MPLHTHNSPQSSREEVLQSGIRWVGSLREDDMPRERGIVLSRVKWILINLLANKVAGWPLRYQLSDRTVAKYIAYARRHGLLAGVAAWEAYANRSSGGWLQ